MKQPAKRSIAIILMVFVLTAMFAGCAQNSNVSKNDQTKQSAAKPTEPLEIKFMSPLFENVPDMNNPWWTEFQKKTNTKWNIEWVPTGDYDSKLDMVLASGDLPDITVSLNLAKPTLVSAIKKGAFWDLTPVLGDFSKYPNLKKNPTPNAWSQVKVDGKIWGVPRSRPQIDLGIKIRKDWLDKLGIPMPATLDEYRVALKKIVDSDMDGNGKKDTLGLIGYGFIMQDSDSVFMTAFGCYDLVKDADGGLIHPYLTGGYSDYVEYMRNLYADGILAKEFSVMKSTQAEELFTTGRAASYTRNIWRDYAFQEQIRKVQPEAAVETIPPMKAPKGGLTAWLARGVYGAFYISKKVPQDKLMRIMDFYESTTTEEWLNMCYFGIEGVHYTMVNGQKTLNDRGTKEIGTSVQQPTALMNNTWAKVVYPGAPKDYNDAKLKSVEVISKLGKINPFEATVSDSWTNTWPKYDKEFQANTIKAIVGQISMEEYRKYQESLRNMPDFKKAFKELTESYNGIFGK